MAPDLVGQSRSAATKAEGVNSPLGATATTTWRARGCRLRLLEWWLVLGRCHLRPHPIHASPPPSSSCNGGLLDEDEHDPGDRYSRVVSEDNGFYVVCDKSGALTTIPESPELNTLAHCRRRWIGGSGNGAEPVREDRDKFFLISDPICHVSISKCFNVNPRCDNAIEDIGEEIKSKLFKAIEHARVALIVFSRNYADSKWCMKELVEILKSRKRFGNHGHLVVPIFHEVKAGDVSNLMGGSEFAQGFERLCTKEGDAGDIQNWRDALIETKHLTGFTYDAREDEGRLVDKIVKLVLEAIRETRLLQLTRNIIGVDLLVGDVISSIKMGQEEDVRIIGICGVQGIGKTKVAEVICEHIRLDFRCFVFLHNIQEAFRNNLIGVLGLQKKLLHNLIKVEGWRMYDDIQTNIHEIYNKMDRQKILLVLDNVSSKKQIKYFGAKERKQLCRGSRILITTRDPNLLKELKVDDTYILKGLDKNNALRLFCRHAFKREEPREGYEELSRNLAHYAGGHPSSLKKLGSFLNGKSEDQWHQTLKKLNAIDDGTHTDVRQIGPHGWPVLDSIAIDYDQNGRLVGSIQHVGHAHDNEKRVRLNHPSEYLPFVSDHVDDCGGHDVVRSLEIHRNKETYSPFGSEQGRPFDLSHSNGKIIGFHGKCSSHLHSIGAYFGPISRVYPFDVMGPFGGNRGMDIWNDGKHTDARQIVIGFDSAIKSISMLYDEHGRPVGLLTHGPSGGGNAHTIKLDHLSEYLTSIGTTRGRHISFPCTSGNIVGFHGDGSRLSIGEVFEPVPHTYPVKIFGPFGGKGQNSWNFTNIKGIAVHYVDFIEAIAFEVDDATNSEPETNYGGNGGKNTFKVKLRKGEYIASFAGYLKNPNGNGTRINSLTFQTNKRILGPIGREEGQYFSLPSGAGKVINFLGTSGDNLESIGAQVEPYYPFKSVGPFKFVGLLESSNASNWDDGNKHNNVRKIIIEFVPRKGPCIQSITFQYEEESKELWQSEIHGGIDDKKFHIVKTVHTIQIQDPVEYLTSISGYYHLHGITSLTFQTNKKTVGPVGDEGGWHFSFPATGGKIVGFYGRSGEYLEAIGAYFEPIMHLYPIKSIGPFGGLGGRAWDDKNFNGVREIEIMYGDGLIFTTCLVLREAFEIVQIELDYPREYLTSISGYKREDGDGNINNDIVQSLTFHSNRRRHGPFGKETGKYFWYPSTGSKIIGFYGTWDRTLKSIGVYAEPIPSLYPFKTIGPFGNSDGTPWDDGVHTDVRGIYMDFAGGGIYGISIGYDDNGSFVHCSRHGREVAPSGYLGLTLDYPKERLVWISFLVNKNGNTADTVIHSLKIHTTKTTYGPFGRAKWNKYAFGKLTEICIPSEPSGGRIVGFFGKAGSHLNSIGARLEPY
ncbi:hypothetical protein BT93_I1595 [Corymbia citriodora subsp. variegata]|nr:hypothetical protein BT93_I1595 [Corymbia citriodora subsp. variegata]